MSIVGRIIYQVYYKPLSFSKRILSRGLIRSWQQETGRRKMMKAAYQLNEILYPGKETFEVFYLTGKKYWYQTALCLYSIQKQSQVNIKAIFIDDGSFDSELEHQVASQFPSSIVIKKEAIFELLNQHLPATQFPVIRKRRLEYPHLRKLTDIHILPGGAPKLVLDSDMVFFKNPVALISWLRKPEELIFLKDSEESYGYSRQLMTRLSNNNNLPPRLNVGIAGIPSDKLDWQKIEWWIAELTNEEGSNYLQEQAITAMIAANDKYFFLDEHEYKVFPSIQAGSIQEILHHYVGGSKYDYFVKAWKHFV